MSAALCEEEEEEELQLEGGGGGRAGGGGGGVIRPKPRFSINEVRVLLQAVRKNRYVLLKRFNLGVSVELKKQTWAQITEQVNELGENHREVRQIMKKWADLKCDGKRRMASLRGSNDSHLRKKTLGPVEMMVHHILTMNPPGGDDSDGEFPDLQHTSTSSCINKMDQSFSTGADFDLSPQSSSDKDLNKDPPLTPSDMDQAEDGESNKDLDVDDVDGDEDAPRPSSPSLDVPDSSLLRVRPLHTYSRNNHNHKRPEDVQASPERPSGPPSPPVASSSSSSSSSQAPPLPPTSPKTAPPPAEEPPTLAQSDPLPSGGVAALVAQMASQSAAQQLAGRLLLTSVSHSLETLAQQVQLLVESQQEFVQESLLLQRETLDVLKDFSATALTMLKDRCHRGQQASQP